MHAASGESPKSLLRAFLLLLYERLIKNLSSPYSKSLKVLLVGARGSNYEE